MTFNTGNPIGSTDARDLSDNAESFDKALGTLDATWTDRLGVTRDSFEGRLAKGSFYRVGDFATGYTLTNMRQTLEYNGHEYGWAGTFPKVVAPGETPATSGGIGAGAWADRTDETLRAELSSSNGSSNIGFSVSETVEDVLLSLNIRKNNTICISDYNLGSDTANFAAAISAANSDVLYTARVIEIPAGEYTITSGFVVEPYVSIKTKGVVRINYTGSGALFTVRYSGSTDPSGDTNGLTQNANNNSELFDGSEGAFILHGLGKTSGQSAVIFGSASDISSSTRHTAWLSCRHVFIDGFQNGLYFNPNNVFIMRFYNVTVSGCGLCIVGPNATNVNAGEQIDWFGCAFHNSNQIMYIGCKMNMEFHGCSFDYGTGNFPAIACAADYQRIRLIGGWVEAPSQAGYPFISSTISSAANRLHVSLDNVYIQPRDKKQTTLFNGLMSLSLHACNFVVNRFTSYPLGADGAGHYLCDKYVQIVECSGNIGFDQMVQVGTNNAMNRNSNFSIDADGTTASGASPTAITGWTHAGGIGASTITVDSTEYNSSTKSLKINSDGTFVTIYSEPMPVISGKFIAANVAIYSPNDAAVNISLYVDFYNASDVLLSSLSTITGYSDYPASWVTLKTGLYGKTPPTATYAKLRFSAGSYSSAFWIDDLVCEFV